MDNKSGVVIKWGLLQVANYKVATSLGSSLRKKICGRNTKARAHCKAKISLSAVLLAKIKDV